MLRQLILNVRDEGRTVIYKIETVEVNGTNVRFIPKNASHAIELVLNDGITSSLRFINGDSEVYVAELNVMLKDGIVKYIHKFNFVDEDIITSISSKYGYFTFRGFCYTYVSMEYDTIEVYADRVVFNYGEVNHEIIYSSLPYTLDMNKMKVHNAKEIHFSDQVYDNELIDNCENYTCNSASIDVFHTTCENTIACRESFVDCDRVLSLCTAISNRSVNITPED